MSRAREICGHFDVPKLGYPTIQLGYRKLGGAMIPPRNEREYLLMQLDEAAHMSPIIRMRRREAGDPYELDVLFRFGGADRNSSKGPPQLGAARDGIARLHGIEARLGKIHRALQKGRAGIDEHIQVAEQGLECRPLGGERGLPALDAQLARPVAFRCFESLYQLH